MPSKATGQFEILLTLKGETPPEIAQKIELAGRTCYKSYEKITTDSAGGFINGILKRGHESVIEHSYFVFLLKNLKAEPILNLILANPLLALGLEQLTTDQWLLSGNARMFRDLFRNAPTDELVRALWEKLAGLAPLLFKDLILAKPTLDFALELNPKLTYNLEQQKKHWWAMVRFKDCSRALTHQLVRHRLMAISQESQRYCDEQGIYKNNYFVTPPAIKAAGLTAKYQEQIKNIDQAYQELQADLKQAQLAGQTNSKINEDARFILPNACCSEIVISTNLQEWRHIFKMRCDSHAQWEIRYLMLDVLREFKKIFPGVFDDFIETPDGESASLI
ncbi:MAG: FAD-dependent thymidylate synthase [Candidatus Buchananbacteria bacterium]